MTHNGAASDRVTFFVATLLLCVGIGVVYSASAEFATIRLGDAERLVINHALRVGISLFAMFTLSRIDYHVLIQLSRPLLALSIVLLTFVLVQGTQLKGAARWLDIAGISLQPSELAKFALLFHLAVRLNLTEHDHLKHWRGVLPLLGWTVLVVALIAFQPNLSTAALVFALAIMLLFIGGIRLTHIASVVTIGMVALGIYAVGADYRLQRLESYFHGDATNAESYQLQQALIGFANGGIIGVGPGLSRQRDLFLPESYGDFIVAIIGEEYGLLGVVALIACYGILVIRGILIARAAPDTLGYLLAWAVTLVVGWYALVNIAVSCGLLPTTGIPLPLVSYGGSSIVFTASAVGILLNISRQGGIDAAA